jgi:hypothetical protein
VKTGRGLYPMEEFGVSGVQPLCSATRELVSVSQSVNYLRNYFFNKVKLPLCLTRYHAMKIYW